jgi:hypothetical protein
MRTTPYFIRTVKGGPGGLDYKAKPARKAAFDKDVTADATDAMEQVIKDGTATYGSRLGRPAAGKTGTTTDNKAAWFDGFTPQLATAVGIYSSGKNGTELSMNDIPGVGELTGATVPLRIWTDFMTEALKGQKVVDFPKRAGLGDDQVYTPPPTTTSSSTTTTTTTTSTTPTTSTTTTTPTTSTTTATATTVTGSHTYDATCSNSVTPDMSTITFTLTGTAPSQVQAGSPISLTAQSWTIDVPGAVLQAGIGLGLLNPGDIVQGSVQAGVFASNTVEGTVTSPDLPVAIGPIAVDNGGQAQPASTTFAVPDMTWTAVGGDVAFEMGHTTMLVTIGPLKVTFTCDPASSGQAFDVSHVVGTSSLAAAANDPPSRVQGAQLARTGAAELRTAVLGVLRIDRGYVMWSATVPKRRRLRRS